MSWFGGEQVHRVPPKSKSDLIWAAEHLLRRFQPGMLARPTPLDHRALMQELEEFNIHVAPVDENRLPHAEGETFLNKDGKSIEIVLREDAYDALELGGPMANRARATLAHEIGHAVLHVPALRHFGASSGRFQRVDSRKIPAYESSEWQAWMFAGALLVPPRSLATLSSPTPSIVAKAYSISSEMAAAHLKRLHML